MKFQSCFKKTIAMTLIVGMLALPLPSLAATATTTTTGTSGSSGNAITKYWNDNQEGLTAGGTSASKIKHNDTGSMVKTVGTGAVAGAASGAISSAAQTAITSAVSSTATSVGTGLASSAASGAVGGLVMGAAGGLITATLGAAWSQIIMGTVGTLMTILLTDYWFMLAVNIDAPQLALEYLVYNAMKNVTDKWDPEPAKKYKQAACSNECGSSVDTSDMDKDVEETEYKWDFEVQVLKDIGIETLGLKKINELAEGRNTVINDLSQLTYKNGKLELDADLTHQSVMSIKHKQSENYQWMSTAGIARAELGLETAYQAAVDAGGDAASEITIDGQSGTISSSTSGNEAIEMSTASPDGPVNYTLKELPSNVTSTGMAQRVQSLMNLELAQRVNLANTLQGNSISIEAARALKQAPGAIRETSDDEGGDDDDE